MTATLELAKALIAQPSLTPHDANCQEILSQRLQQLSFQIESMPFEDVKNLYARRGKTGPVLLFAGHTDVVPPGPLDKWTSPPFEPTLRDGNLYGRGAADMKSSLAAMVCASEHFINLHPDHKGSIAFLITSDEEGNAINGTQKVVQELFQRQEQITWCLVGEASSERQFGDTVKVGRRGSLNGTLIIFGKQGHIAYPAKADNPIPKSLAALDKLCRTKWDNGNDSFPATSFQISNLQAGTGANNVIPGHLEIIFNFRYSTEVTADQLKQRVYDILDAHNLHYDLLWQPPSKPFLSKQGPLLQATEKAIFELCQIKPKPSTSGGTSDGRFIIDLGCELLELGPINASIHQVDEHIKLTDLELLTEAYYKIMVSLLA